ncbi:cysteine desulfurase family protein [Bernardetia sp.]|uniref:cysteine desulfurase family protein n=1 Tax=Bernardetia sp. TaxID=1937974 RepID=UPI0025B81B15|nr:cysteine desulfurase family protein [Bernardetia sp.]
MSLVSSSSRIYLDNAATTRLDKAVLDEMMPYLTEHFGNPSSTHSTGRIVKSAVEKARKTVAGLLNTSPAEIFFTSGGTEADNTTIRCAVRSHNLKHIITSPLEHHAVLHTVEELEKRGEVKVSLVNIDKRGNIDLNHLDELLSKNERSLVSLMHGNNEIGTITDLNAVGEICQKYDAMFHSDTVQTMGYYEMDLQALPVHYIVGSAHKFHGAKGVGFLYIRHDAGFCPFQTGGAQERNMRGGTENVAGIVGLAKALEISLSERENHKKHILSLKSRMIDQLRANFGEDIHFNGESGNLEKGLPKVLNVQFPKSDMGDMLLFNLDIQGISASGGSACSSGSEIGSHVLTALQNDPARPSVRFSFSKYNTAEEIDFVVEKVNEIYAPVLAK